MQVRAFERCIPLCNYIANNIIIWQKWPLSDLLKKLNNFDLSKTCHHGGVAIFQYNVYTYTISNKTQMGDLWPHGLPVIQLTSKIPFLSMNLQREWILRSWLLIVIYSVFKTYYIWV